MRQKTAMVARGLSVFALAVMGVACGPDRIVATLPPDVRVDSYTQQAASKIDVLWVVDNSGSMAPRQENLARNFGSFIDLFTRSSIDYRIAVTTTDIFKDKGALKGNPRVITPQTANVAGAFSNNIKVGIQGSPFEAGLEAGRMAITLQKEANTLAIEQCKRSCAANKPACLTACDEKKDFPFLRPDAYLYLVFVTDEEDESREDVRFYYRFFETVKGIGNDGMVTTAAIMGPEANGCGATPGVRYKEMSDLTGGEVGSICDAAFGATLANMCLADHVPPIIRPLFYGASLCALVKKGGGVRPIAVGSGGALLGIGAQLAQQAARVRQVEDHQAAGHLGVQHGEGPGDRAAPVVADDHRPLLALIADHRGDVADQIDQLVLLDALRLVAQVVAALIERGDPIARCQRLHLIAPRIPEVGKAVQHHHQRATPSERRVVDGDAVVVDIVVADAVEDVGGCRCGGGEQDEQGGEARAHVRTLPRRRAGRPARAGQRVRRCTVIAASPGGSQRRYGWRRVIS